MCFTKNKTCRTFCFLSYLNEWIVLAMSVKNIWCVWYQNISLSLNITNLASVEQILWILLSLFCGSLLIHYVQPSSSILLSRSNIICDHSSSAVFTVGYWLVFSVKFHCLCNPGSVQINWQFIRKVFTKLFSFREYFVVSLLEASHLQFMLGTRV